MPGQRIKNIKALLNDERGITTVEAIIVTILLGAGAILTWSIYRNGMATAASAVSQKAVSVVSSGTSW
jgi:predicted negative regulator of RcsB-dependent stress response